MCTYGMKPIEMTALYNTVWENWYILRTILGKSMTKQKKNPLCDTFHRLGLQIKMMFMLMWLHMHIERGLWNFKLNFFYTITCKNCHKEYTGETSSNINKRLCLQNNTLNTLVYHCNESDYNFDFLKMLIKKINV